MQQMILIAQLLRRDALLHRLRLCCGAVLVRAADVERAPITRA